MLRKLHTKTLTERTMVLHTEQTLTERTMVLHTEQTLTERTMVLHTEQTLTERTIVLHTEQTDYSKKITLKSCLWVDPFSLIFHNFKVKEFYLNKLGVPI